MKATRIVLFMMLVLGLGIVGAGAASAAISSTSTADGPCASMGSDPDSPSYYVSPNDCTGSWG